MLEEFYKIGALKALEDAGLLNKGAADTMHPIVQKGLESLRASAQAQGNRYAGGYYPNVPSRGGAPAPARSTPAQAAPAEKPFDYGSAIGAASDKYTGAIANQGSWTRK